MMAVLLPSRNFRQNCLIRQLDRFSLYKSPRGSQVPSAKQAGAAPPSLGIVQFSLSKSDTCAMLHEYGSRYSVPERTSTREWRHHNQTTWSIFKESRGGPLCLEREHPLHNIVLEGKRHVIPKVVLSAPLHLPSSTSVLPDSVHLWLLDRTLQVFPGRP